ncbi:hypothetical protein R76727_04527 [Ralstonia mannitolilytica]|nr:hypothetical protein R76727_04527 [Ralstonia mannitolilytica]
MPSRSHSNVVVLFNAHRNDQSEHFRYYMPGVGTAFKEIGEPEETDAGKAYAAGGEARIHWGMLQVLNAVCRASIGANAASTDAGLLTTAQMKRLVTTKSGLPLGKAVLAHMRQYWRYRVSAAVLRTRGKKTTEQKSIQGNEDDMFKKDRARLKSQADKQERSYRLAAAEVDAAEQAAEAAKQSPGFSNQEPFWRAKAQEASSRRDKAYDSWRRTQARLDTAADDSDLLENMQTYDKWLLEDAELIYKWHKEDPNKRMRPHYAAIVSAYEEVVVNGKVLAETSDLYKFFSTGMSCFLCVGRFLNLSSCRSAWCEGEAVAV